MATLNDVAREAEVSAITVSRVMNGSSAVRPETKERVLAAVKKLNYQPNLLARSLSADRMNSIGVIMTWVENPMYSLMVSGINREAAKYGYDIILSCSYDLESSMKSVATLLSKRVSGLVVLPIEYHSDLQAGDRRIFTPHDQKMMGEFGREFGKLLERSAPENFPVITVGGQFSEGVKGRVIENYGGGASMAVDYLVGKGHSKIGILAHNAREEGIWGERYRGFLQAMEKHGIKVKKDWIAYCDETLASAGKAMEKLLMLPERPSAVYCANDIIAVGALNAAADAGVKVPEDISVMGHDGSSFGEMVRPALTTVAIYPMELGMRAVRLFMDVMRGESGADMVLTPRIVERESVRDIREKI